jgi:cytochrome P450
MHSVFAGVLPTKMRYFEYSEALHKKYKSDVIRTGPREVIIFTADAIPLVHGPLSKCTKGQWYDAASHLDAPSTQTTRDKQEHRRRRKLWDQAFSAKALREYEPRLNRHALALMTQLKEQAKKPYVRVTDWFNFYSFDVMGDIGFSRSFGMVEKGEEDPMIKLLHASMQPLAIFSHLTWCLALLTRTKTGAKPLVAHVEWTREVIRKRVKVGYRNWPRAKDS